VYEPSETVGVLEHALSEAEIDRALALAAEGRAIEALAITTPLAQIQEASHLALVGQSQILKALGRHEEALAFDERATRRFPNSGVAWHNLGATLNDMGRGEPAALAIDQAFKCGLDASETWAVYARALMATAEHDRAEAAYVEARKRAMADAALTAEYANYVWMRRGDLALGLAALDTCFHAGGDPGALLQAKARLLDAAGQASKASDLLQAAADRLPQDVSVQLAAAHSAIEQGRLATAEQRVQAAQVLSPESARVLNQMAILRLAQGRPEDALAAAKRGLERAPHDQSLLGWAATAARLTGDPLHGSLYDYDALVGVYEIDAPKGWATLEAYLADLASALNALHLYQQHPSTQSLRHGAQTFHKLTGSSHPAIQAFFQAIDAPVRTHMDRLGRGADPHRSRNTGDYGVEGAWSVRLRPGGFHKDHFHSQGWLSSAFYVETPDVALDREDREGWLRFGQPPIATVPPLLADHYVRPKPGRLALFPSYMWHGTVPFTTDEKRLTIAFDLVPR
jgi:Flp pilus assembly protein TadD